MFPRILVLLCLLSTVSFAHPGHGRTEPHGWLHYLTEPLHVGLLAGAVVATFAALRWRVRSRVR